MGISQLNLENVTVRLARNNEEVRASQRLRYKVFYEEYKAQPDENMKAQRRDIDKYDDVADHLIVLDESHADIDDRIVGTYRLLQKDGAEKCGGFYTSSEFNITALQNSNTTLLELGRSCVLPDYRTRPVMQLLWQGITNYTLNHNIEVLFGCASLYGTDLDALSEQLAYLYHYHLASDHLRTHAVPGRYVDMNRHDKDSLNQRAVFATLPPLIKGYLRVGAAIGDGAVVDHQFNTTDICIILPTDRIAGRYRRHYERKLSRAENDSDGNKPLKVPQ